MALPAIRKDAMNTQNTSNSVARVVSLTAAAVGLVIVLAGALVVGIHVSTRDGDGFYASGANDLGTPTHALVSDGLDIGTGGAGRLFHGRRLATIRVTATGTQEHPIFVGLARKAEVAAYLRGVAHDEITDFEVDPFSVERTRHAGTAAPPAPTQEPFWTRSASGSGRQAISWPVQTGRWAVVVMNADGSAGVHTRVGVGAKVPVVLWVGLGALAAGAVLLVGGGFAAYRSLRRPSRRAATVTARAQPGVGGR